MSTEQNKSLRQWDSLSILPLGKSHHPLCYSHSHVGESNEAWVICRKLLHPINYCVISENKGQLLFDMIRVVTGSISLLLIGIHKTILCSGKGSHKRIVATTKWEDFSKSRFALTNKFDLGFVLIHLINHLLSLYSVHFMIA